MDTTKPFTISKKEVLKAWEHVKSNKGSAGIDNETIEMFEKDLKKNLYRIWNRMSSGTYFPPSVKSQPIPKKGGGVRILGIPTVSDRIAQAVVKNALEPALEKVFSPHSFGYRPGKSAHQAVEQAKINCWQCHWGIDLDIKGFFDNIDHVLLLKAVRKHTESKWVILFIERWLKAPMESEDGTLTLRTKGTPQGGVISPLLANIFLHYTFDLWVTREFPLARFERYADDIVIHCVNLQQASEVRRKVEIRFRECGLELNKEKTKIFYCKDDKRNWGTGYPDSFDFLGFTFRQRTARGKNGTLFMGFQPALSLGSRRKMSATIRSWHIGRRSDLSIEEMSHDLNSTIRGWVNYYGKFNKNAFSPMRKQFHIALTRWALRKYSARFNHSRKQASKFVYEIARTRPELFAFWSNFYNEKRNG